MSRLLPKIEKEAKPLYRVGQIVNVIDYYDDMILRGYYLALVLDIRSVSYRSIHSHASDLNFMYDLLPLKDGRYNKYRNVAEESQIVAVDEE